MRPSDFFDVVKLKITAHDHTDFVVFIVHDAAVSHGAHFANAGCLVKNK